MTERAQALEAAREWQAIEYGDRPETWAALDYYREGGWPVDVNTFPERARVEDRLFSFMAGYREARRLAVQPPPPVGSPTTERDQLREALAAIQQSTRDDEKGEQWTIRNFLNKHGVFNDDISGSRRLVAEACRYVLSTPVEPAGASEPPSEAMRQGHYYGNPLEASIEEGRLVIAIGIQTLAHATAFADWANPFDEAADDYIRTFAIEDAPQFAKDVVSAMLSEREDGSTPLSDFLDKMAQVAIEDGSLGLHEDDQRITHGTYAPCETWATAAEGGR